MNQMIAGGQPMVRSVSVKPVREASAVRSAQVAAPTAQEPAATEAAGRSYGPGRAHIQQDIHHLAKAVRADMRAEMREMKAAGTWTPERAAALREMGGEFLAQLHDAVKAAGRGHDFDGGKVPEGVRQAIVNLTEKLAAFNGTQPAADGDGDGDEPAPAAGSTPGTTKIAPEVATGGADALAGLMLDAMA